MDPEIIAEIESKKNLDQKKRFLFFLCFGILFFIGTPIIFFVLKSTSNQASKVQTTNARIQGYFNINGTVPTGATIAVAKRKIGTPDFITEASGISALDGAVWSISDAVGNVNYDVQAYVQIDGQNVASSDIVTVTAPADKEVLTFNIDSPKPTTEKASISGIFDLNGHIPPGSTIILVETMEGKTDEVLVNNKINAVDNGLWQFDDAQKGVTYTLKAYLKNQGEIIGKSDPLIVNAPGINEVIRINSLAVTTPMPTSVVSQTNNIGGSTGIYGSINLNGPILANTRIVIIQRVAGTNQFNVAVDNINSKDGATWAWNNATPGISYELLAVLKQKQSNNTDADLAYSQRLIVSAPALNEILTINTGLSIPPPSSTPNVSCNNQNSSGQWNITLTYNNINNAGQYWIELGSQSGGNDILNSIGYQSNNNPQTASAVVNNNTTYYARYAYAYCSGCSNSASFSGFSNTLTFSCPQGPNPTPTSTPTPSPTDTPTPTEPAPTN